MATTLSEVERQQPQPRQTRSGSILKIDGDGAWLEWDTTPGVRVGPAIAPDYLNAAAGMACAAVTLDTGELLLIGVW